MKGWVYVITNKAMPGLVKVGFSMKDTEIRASELNHTGTPHPYVVEYDVLVESPRDIEQSIHKCLQAKKEGKEWFRCTPEEAVAEIRAFVRGGALLENYKRVDRYRAEVVRHQKIFETVKSETQMAKELAYNKSLMAEDYAKQAVDSAQKAKDSAKRANSSAQKSASSAERGVIASKKWFRSEFHEHPSFWNKKARGVDWLGQDGYGVAIYRDGRRYEGEWKNNNCNGYGIQTWPSSNRYEGEFQDGYLHGYGVMTWPSGNRYEGEFQNGNRSGYGVYTWSIGNHYEGEWRNGKIDGLGMRFYLDGIQYKGCWSDDYRAGYGVQTWPDGRKYQGYWLNDKMESNGVFTWPDGNHYEGEFLDDNRSGYGAFTWPNGNHYEGKFQNGNRSGYGAFTWPDGNHYEGEFLDDNRSGYGVYTWPNGNRYAGEWRGGNQHGDGAEFVPDGSIIKSGFWQDGKLIDESNRLIERAKSDTLHQRELIKKDEELKTKPSSYLRLTPSHSLQWEESLQKYVILYPEGTVELNQSGAEILKLCDGFHNLEQIVSQLELSFATTDLFKDIDVFLETAIKNGWVQCV